MEYYLLEEKIKAKLIEEQGQGHGDEYEDKKPKIHKKCKWTQRQKIWLLERDDYRCQLNGCRNTKNLEGHHIIPATFAMAVLEWTKEQINSPFNGIILCGKCHRPKIHRGTVIKYTNKAKIYRQKFLDKRPYWNTAFDDIMKQTAKNRTTQYLLLNPDNPFPIFPTT